MIDVIIFLVCLICAFSFIINALKKKANDGVDEDATPVDFNGAHPSTDDEQDGVNKDGKHERPVTEEVDE